MCNQPTVLLCLIAALMAVTANSASAQKMTGRGPSPDIGSRGPIGPTGGGNGPHGGGFRGPGWGAVVPGIILGLPQNYPSNSVYIDDGSVNDSPRRSQQSNRRGPSGAPPANERRLVPDEVVIEISNSASAQQIDALQRRHRLARIETQTFQLTGTTLYRWRIPDRRSVTTVVRELEGDRVVASAQPNYLFTLQQGPTDKQTGSAAKIEGDPAQYELARLHLPQAHALAKGDNVLVAVIDSGIDIKHPELAGSIAGVFDTAREPAAAHKHGTAIAGLIAAHAKLMGAAPAAKILAVHAFDPNNAGAEGTTFNILKGIDWAAAARRARHQYELCRASRSRHSSQPRGGAQERHRAGGRRRQCRSEIAAALSGCRSQRDRRQRDRHRRQIVRAIKSRPPISQSLRPAHKSSSPLPTAAMKCPPARPIPRRK